VIYSDLSFELIRKCLPFLRAMNDVATFHEHSSLCSKCMMISMWETK